MNHEIPIRIQATLTTIFPGLEIRPRKAIGGVLFAIQIWEYTLDVRVTTDSIARGDIEGRILCTFRRKVNQSTEILDTLNTEKLEEAETFAENVKTVLLGIGAAIEQAFLSSPADLFDGT